MKLTDPAKFGGIYHVMRKSYYETIMYNDNLEVIVFGTPNVVNLFISKRLPKDAKIYYYSHLKSDKDIYYSFYAMYEGKPIIEAQKEAQEEPGPKQSKTKPAS
jgi:hypothetical protein